jgi:hypothetical protein
MRLNGHVRCKNGHKNYNIKIKWKYLSI